MPAKKIRLIDDLEIDTEKEQEKSSTSNDSKTEVEDIKKILQAMDWKLWEMYQIAKKFQDYFEIK